VYPFLRVEYLSLHELSNPHDDDPRSGGACFALVESCVDVPWFGGVPRLLKSSSELKKVSRTVVVRMEESSVRLLCLQLVWLGSFTLL
jgi:hypothetical protein